MRRSAAAPARSGLTLFELLIVLGLILAMAALAVPVVYETVRRRQFEGAVDDVVGVLRLARSHARLEAATVEVLLVHSESGASWLVARRVDLTELASADGSDDDAVEPIGESWAERRIDADLTVEDSANSSVAASPSDVDSSAPGEAGSEPQSTTAALDEAALPSDAEDPDGRPRRVALFAADGSAPISGRLTLRSDDGRTATVRVNPWTGLAAMEGSIAMAKEAE